MCVRHASHIEGIFANREEVAGDTVADTRSPQAAAPAAWVEVGRGGGRERRSAHLGSSLRILPSCAGGQAGGQIKEG